AALARPRVVDGASGAAFDVPAPRARRFADLVDRHHLAAQHAGAAFAARNDARPRARLRAGRIGMRVGRHAAREGPAAIAANSYRNFAARETAEGRRTAER